MHTLSLHNCPVHARKRTHAACVYDEAVLASLLVPLYVCMYTYMDVCTYARAHTHAFSPPISPLLAFSHLLRAHACTHNQRDEFVEWCLEALRARWFQGGLIVDGHFFSERGIIRIDALEDPVGGAQGAALQTPPEGHVWLSVDGREDMSVSKIGDTVGPLPPGAWARKLDQRCLEVRGREGGRLLAVASSRSACILAARARACP